MMKRLADLARNSQLVPASGAQKPNELFQTAIGGTNQPVRNAQRLMMRNERGLWSAVVGVSGSESRAKGFLFAESGRDDEVDTRMGGQFAYNFGGGGGPDDERSLNTIPPVTRLVPDPDLPELTSEENRQLGIEAQYYALLHNQYGVKLLNDPLGGATPEGWDWDLRSTYNAYLATRDTAQALYKFYTGGGLASYVYQDASRPTPASVFRGIMGDLNLQLDYDTSITDYGAKTAAPNITIVPYAEPTTNKFVWNLVHEYGHVVDQNSGRAPYYYARQLIDENDQKIFFNGVNIILPMDSEGKLINPRPDVGMPDPGLGGISRQDTLPEPGEAWADMFLYWVYDAFDDTPEGRSRKTAMDTWMNSVTSLAYARNLARMPLSRETSEEAARRAQNTIAQSISQALTAQTRTNVVAAGTVLGILGGTIASPILGPAAPLIGGAKGSLIAGQIAGGIFYQPIKAQVIASPTLMIRDIPTMYPDTDPTSNIVSPTAAQSDVLVIGRVSSADPHHDWVLVVGPDGTVGWADGTYMLTPDGKKIKETPLPSLSFTDLQVLTGMSYLYDPSGMLQRRPISEVIGDGS